MSSDLVTFNGSIRLELHQTLKLNHCPSRTPFSIHRSTYRSDGQSNYLAWLAERAALTVLTDILEHAHAHEPAPD